MNLIWTHAWNCGDRFGFTLESQARVFSMFFTAWSHCLFPLLPVLIAYRWVAFPASQRGNPGDQWERWRAKRQLVSGFKHRGRFGRVRGLSLEKEILRLYVRNLTILCIFSRKMVRNAVHNALINTITNSIPIAEKLPKRIGIRQLFNNGNGVPTRPPLEMTPSRRFVPTAG